METKNIAYASSNEYMQHLGVTLTSLLNNNPNEHFKVFIFGHDIMDIHKKNIETIISPFNCSVEYITIDKDIFSHVDVGRVNIATYYRLLLSKYIPVDKLLFIDVDTIVNNPINELYDTNIEDYYVAAVEDATQTKDRHEFLNMDGNARYFNAGIILVNLKKWREDKLFEVFMKYIEGLTTQLKAHDQDILNSVLNGRWKRIPLKYNQYEKNPDIEKYILPSFFTRKELEEARQNPVIIHYVGVRKPWHYTNKHIKKYLYWKYLAMTPYKNYKPSDKTFSKIISKNTPMILKNPKRYFRSLFS